MIVTPVRALASWMRIPPDSACRAEHEERAGGLCGQVELVKQGLPSGDRRQRTRSGLCMCQVRGLGADDALIHELLRCVAACAVEAPGVEHFVAGAEQGGLVACREDRPGGVPPENPILASTIAGGADLHIYRVHRHRPHLDEQIPADRRCRCWDLGVDEAVRPVDWAARPVNHCANLLGLLRHRFPSPFHRGPSSAGTVTATLSVGLRLPARETSYPDETARRSQEPATAPSSAAASASAWARAS